MKLRMKNRYRPFYSIPLVAIAGSVLIVGGGFLTAVAYGLVRQQVARQAEQAFQEITDGHVHEFIHHMTAYGDALYATRGLFAATDVDSGAWSRFIRSQSAPDRYTGMKAIAYAEVVPHDKIGEFERLLQETQSKDITIHPVKNQGDYTVLVYHEEVGLPDTKRIGALGFDLTANPERHDALERAQNNGTMAATAPINLITNGEYGFLLVLPLTDRLGKQSGQPAFGYSIAAFELDGLINSTIGDRLDHYRTTLNIDDATDGRAAPLYSKTYTDGGSMLSREVAIQVADRTWSLTFQMPEKSLLITAQRVGPFAVLAIGIGFITIICVLSYALRLRRRLKQRAS